MASRFWVGGTGTWDAADTTHWAASSAGAGGQSVPVDGDTVTFDGSSGGGTVTLGYSPTVTSITCGAFTGTLDFSTFSPTMDTFNGSGTGTRTITMTNMGTMTLRGNAATIINFTTTTNLTLNGGGTINCTYAGSTGTRTIIGTGASFYLANLNISAGTDIVNISSNTLSVGNFILTGFSGTWSGNQQLKFTGNFTMSATVNRTFTGALAPSATSGTQNITSNTITFASAFSQNSPGATVKLLDDFVNSSASTNTLTAGTFDANNFNVTCGIFSSSNSNTRVLTMGSGTWTITGSGTCWTTATDTNLTIDGGTSTIYFTYSGASSRDLLSGSSTYVNNVVINAGSGTTSLTINCNDFEFTSGYTGLGGLPTRIKGNLTLGVGVTLVTSATAVNFTRTSGTSVITSNGVTIKKPVTINGVGGTVQLADNLTVDVDRTITLTNGTFNTANFHVTCGAFSSSNANTRVITLGSSTITLTGTGTVWNTATTTNLTLTANTATIKLTDSSASTKTFSGGGLTFNYVWLAPGAGTGEFDFVGSNTFTNFLDDGTVAHAIKFTAGTTNTFTNAPDFSGASGARITISSITGATHTLVLSNGSANLDFLDISYSIATGNQAWYAGANSVDSGNNTGWIFSPYRADLDHLEVGRFDQDRFQANRFQQNRFY